MVPQKSNGFFREKFNQKMKIGQLCIKLAGRDANKLCVIVDTLENNFVLIDGNTRRRKCNIKHLEPLDKVLKIKKKALHQEVIEAMKKESLKVIEKKKTKEMKQKKEKLKKIRKIKIKKEPKKKIKEEKKEKKEKPKKIKKK